MRKYLYKIAIALLGSVVLTACTIQRHQNYCADDTQIYVRFNSHSTMSSAVLQDLVIQEMQQKFPKFKIVTREPVARINVKPGKSQQELAKGWFDRHDYYSYGEIRKIYPGAVIFDLNLQQFSDSLVGFDVKVIAPETGKIIFYTRNQVTTHVFAQYPGKLLRPALMHAKYFMQNEYCAKKTYHKSLENSWSK